MDKFIPATIEDIIEDPKKFNAPTFEEFMKNRDYYLGKDDSKLGMIDYSTTLLRPFLRKQYYAFENYTCQSLVECERIAASEGYDLKKCKFEPQVIPLEGQRVDILVRFRRPLLYAV